MSHGEESPCLGSSALWDHKSFVSLLPWLVTYGLSLPTAHSSLLPGDLHPYPHRGQPRGHRRQALHRGPHPGCQRHQSHRGRLPKVSCNPLEGPVRYWHLGSYCLNPDCQLFCCKELNGVSESLVLRSWPTTQRMLWYGQAVERGANCPGHWKGGKASGCRGLEEGSGGKGKGFVSQRKQM